MKKIQHLLFCALVILLYVSCTPDFDVRFDAPSMGGYGGYAPDRITVSLNPTEQKLKGRWNLVSITAKDTVYQDSSYRATRYVDFTDQAYPNAQTPLLDDYFVGLPFKAIPSDPATFMTSTVHYRAEDSVTLRFYLVGGDSTAFSITTLTEKKLTLNEEKSGKIWQFER